MAKMKIIIQFIQCLLHRGVARWGLFGSLLIVTAAAAAEQPGLVRTEFVFESAPFPACHAATIVETAEGLAVAFFGGTHERHPDVGIWVCRNTGGGWSAPVEVANGAGFATNRFPTWNPVLFQPARGPLMLFYKVGPSPSEWWGMRLTSSDQGKSWSQPARLPDGVLGPIKNKPVQLANGEILSPSSSEGSDGWRVHFERSNDGGRTWTAGPPVNDGTNISAIQPSILLHSQSRLQAVGRTRQNRLFTIWTEDGGRSWGKMKLMALPNPNSGTDAITLRDGRHLLVYNHSSIVEGRCPLNVAVSSNGRDWQAALVLETDPGKKNGYAYPAVIQGRDGLAHIVYTWDRKRIKYARVDPEKLETQPILDGAWPGD